MAKVIESARRIEKALAEAKRCRRDAPKCGYEREWIENQALRIDHACGELLEVLSYEVRGTIKEHGLDEGSWADAFDFLGLVTHQAAQCRKTALSDMRHLKGALRLQAKRRGRVCLCDVCNENERRQDAEAQA